MKLYTKKGDSYKGDSYEDDTFFGVALVECFALRVRGRQSRRRGRCREKCSTSGQLSSGPRLFSASRTNRSQLHLRGGATGGSRELSGQITIPHRGLRSSPSEFRKSAFPAKERQPRTALPWPYVVSFGRPKGGANEYPARYGGS